MNDDAQMTDDPDAADLEELSKVAHRGFLGLTGDVYDWEDEDIARAMLKSAWLAAHDKVIRAASRPIVHFEDDHEECARELAEVRVVRDGFLQYLRIAERNLAAQSAVIEAVRDAVSASRPMYTSEEEWRADQVLEVRSILNRTPPLPSEPGTFWLDDGNTMWIVDQAGDFYCPGDPLRKPHTYAPFRQLVLKC